MALKKVLCTITDPYGLAVYDRPDATGSTYFAERTAKRSYDAVGKQFESSYSESNGGPVVYIATEKDNVGIEYLVSYIPDNTISPYGYHVYMSKVNDGDRENWDNATKYIDCEITLVLPEDVDYGTVTATEDGTTAEDVASDYIGASTGYEVDLNSILNFEGSWQHETDGTEFFNSRSVLGIFGIPYQFMAHVDPRLDYTNAGTGAYITNNAGTGREYAHHIISDMPILFLSPGLPNFMTRFNKNERNNIVDYMKDLASNAYNTVANISDLTNNSGKYYTFEYAVPQYYQYCNPACRIAAAYMNITDKTIDGVSTDRVNWKDYTTKTLSTIFSNIADVSSYASIPFYIDSDNQIGESFGNDIADSSLTGIIDSVSEMGKEAMFILGYGNASLNAGVDFLSKTNDPESIKDQLTSTFGSLANGNGFLSNVIGQLSSVATGGRLIFPKIWSDSSFSRSYDVSIKLRSPDMDRFSIYCNIIVPYLHLVCLVLPRQISDNPNGFYSPFLVRAIYKGFFNVDMGIITSMSVSKGDSGQWNADGIPCAIDINLSIADLYENMSMTPTTFLNDRLTGGYDTMDNTCFMDYIANLCGVNIYTPEVGRTIRMWFVNNFVNRATDVIDIGLWGNIQNSIANAITNVWRHGSL